MRTVIAARGPAVDVVGLAVLVMALDLFLLRPGTPSFAAIGVVGGMAVLVLAAQLNVPTASALVLSSHLISDVFSRGYTDSSSPATIASSMATIGFALWLLRRPVANRTASTLGLAWILPALLLCYVALRALTGDVPREGLGDLARFATYGAAAVVGCRGLTQRTSGRTLPLVIVWIGVAEVAVAVIQRFTGQALAYSTAGVTFLRPAGTFIHPDWLAFYLVVATCAALMSIRSLSLRLLTGALFTAGIAVTQSRGPLVLLVGVLLVAAALQRRIRLFMSGGAVVAFAMLTPAIRNRFTDEIVGGQLIGSYATRSALRSAALTAWHQAPWLGLGEGHFFAVTAPTYFGVDYEAHSDWLKFLVDGGLVGLIAYLAVGVAVITALYRIPTPEARTVGALLIACWLYSYIDVLHRLVTVQVFLWALVGYAFSTRLTNASPSRNSP